MSVGKSTFPPAARLRYNLGIITPFNQFKG
jgi:hypothetical protein